MELLTCTALFEFYHLTQADPACFAAEILVKGKQSRCSNKQRSRGKSKTFDGRLMNPRSNMVTNIVLNHNFAQGLASWHLNCCQGFVVPTETHCNPEEHLAKSSSGGGYAVITDRKESWQGIEQDITGGVSPDLTYTVSACVGVGGSVQGHCDVQATLRLECHDSTTQYLFIARTPVRVDRWEILKGTFTLSAMPKRVVFYLEGPSPGVDLLIKSVEICSLTPDFGQSAGRVGCGVHDGDDNVIINPQFEDGLNNWSGNGCKLTLQESMNDGKIVPLSGKAFAVATGRTATWNGIQQEITGRVQRKRAYEVNVVVRIYGGGGSGSSVTSSKVGATLWVQTPDSRDQYVGISSVQATDKDWTNLQGKFLLNGSPSRVVIYLEGPPSGVDILVNSLVVKHAKKIPPTPPPVIEDPGYGVNIVQNSELSDGITNSWFPLGNCILSVQTGSPHILPPMARSSLGPQKQLSGRYILATKRTQNWMGPAQMITNHVKLFLTYQVSAWVRIGPGASGPQNINIALSVDDQWVNGGQVEVVDDDLWHEVGGSFRIEKQASKVMVYVQGPGSGVDIMLAGLQIFSVDRRERFKHLRRQADQIRKRDVVLKFSGSAPGSSVKVLQTNPEFPLGACINRTNIDNEDFVTFFVKNFNWAVFGNELKWYWTEPQRGKLNYKDADDMVDLCQKNNIQLRGHCIFWDVEDTVQSWLKSLSDSDLLSAVQDHINSLLTRYKGKFKHYDVNNEMLHGSYYPNRLGKDIRANMFKKAHELDPDVLLFVNDYHVEDGCDVRACPHKYIEQILDLQEQGAPVGGIGIQGHIDSPVGSIVCTALDQLGILGLPIWFTELDVSSVNEHVRADDLEVMLREAFAHPAVEGIVLWGFWELSMSRENSHLVDAEGDLNEAGKRLVELRKEWTSHARGDIDEKGEFKFRGFHGTYVVEVATPSSSGKNVSKKKMIVVDKGESPLVVLMDL